MFKQELDDDDEFEKQKDTQSHEQPVDNPQLFICTTPEVAAECIITEKCNSHKVTTASGIIKKDCEDCTAEQKSCQSSNSTHFNEKGVCVNIKEEYTCHDGPLDIPDDDIFEECSNSDAASNVPLPSLCGRKRRKGKRSMKKSSNQQSSSVFRQPRKRRPANDYFTASVNLSMLPRRSSNRLRRRQAEHSIDYSHLPPKFKGPLSPSMHFCHYVLEQLMSAKYEPINWLIDLATVKKKLDYRQFEDSDEFAAEIRNICMNPLDDSLADDSLALLHAFEELWIYMPLDPDIPLIPDEHKDMDESELRAYAMLAALINIRKKCQFYTNQLGLCLRRAREIKEVQRTALDQNNVSLKLPTLLKENINIFAGKLRPYASVSVDAIASDNCWLSAIAPVAPELMELLGESAEVITTNAGNVNPVSNSEEEMMLSEENQAILVNDIEGLPDDAKAVMLRMLAGEENIRICTSEQDPSIHVELTDANPSTIRKLVEYVAEIKEKQDTGAHKIKHETTGKPCDHSEAKCSDVTLANKKVVRNAVIRRQSRISKRKAVDIEARKRELVEGIKKLGGTGTTRPVRKQAPYAEPRPLLKTTYVYRSSSSSLSETTTSTDSWDSQDSFIDDEK
ncbi:unnamed protein product [Cylicocyclus nassatus]|uniref:NET domain-containing protein n=1 Tax=Cylicocyclus nassatus TaxID=53992 RepID=A0AA36M914_CYLNA|nr:unnamed protein product [Cylicocyclus nassatus]